MALFYTSERLEATGINKMTFGQLKVKVTKYANALKSLGVQMGDRVVGYMPNCPEAIIAMAATASIGAVWSSTSPDFGVAGVLDRFRQIRPKIIFSVESVSYNMKTHDHMVKLREVVNGLGDAVENVIVVPFVKQPKDVKLQGAEIWEEDFLNMAGEESGAVLTYEQVPFDHPLFIMYSSGTTGKPKCMVHSVGGTLMKHLEEHQVG